LIVVIPFPTPLLVSKLRDYQDIGKLEPPKATHPRSFCADEVLAPNPRYRLRDYHPLPPAWNEAESLQTHTTKGAILDADPQPGGQDYTPNNTAIHAAQRQAGHS
jgi:hypothetical protein